MSRTKPYDFVFNIVGDNNPHQCLNLLKSIEEGYAGYNVQVVVTTTDNKIYAEVREYIKKHKWCYINYTEDTSERHRWKAYNKSLSMIKNFSFKYLVQLSESYIISPSFLSYMDTFFNRRGGSNFAVNLTPDKTLDREFKPGKTLSNAAIFNAHTMNQLEWRIKPIGDRQWNHVEDINKLIWEQLTERLLDKQYTLYQLNNTYTLTLAQTQVSPNDKVKIHRLQNNFEKTIINQPPDEGVSILITAYNTEDFIEECLDSVENQTYFKNNKNYEILLGIDNCETTLEKVKLIQNNYTNLRVFMMDSNKGTYVTSNTLLFISKYNKLIRFDSDDIMKPNMISKIIKYHKKHPEDAVIRYKFKNFGLIPYKMANSFNAGCVFFKKEVFTKFGGWKDWVCSADAELLTRIEKHVKIGYIDDVLMNRRIHPKGLTRAKKTRGDSDIRIKNNNLIKSTNYSTVKYVNPVINTYKEIRSKPNICFIYDIKGWAFYHIATNIKNTIGDKFNIDVIQFNKLKQQDKYDIIIAFSPRVLPRKIKHLNNIICGLSSHFGQLNKDVARFSHVFTNSKLIYEVINKENKYYTPNGVDTTFFKQRAKNKPNKKVRIGTLGSTSRRTHKGENRLNAIIMALQEDGYEVVNKSVFIDPQKNIMSKSAVKKFYKNLDIFVISSESETGPNTLLEAQAMGVPVVANITGLAPEIITNGINGYLIDSYDNIDGYVAAIKNIIDYPKIFKTMSVNARKRILRYDWREQSKYFESMIREYLEYYE